MMQFDAWKFPDGEKHLPEWMSRVNKRVDGRLTYQYHKYESALKYVGRRRTAVDIGGHVGLWSWFMARDFENVVAFEPMGAHADCWEANMADRPNAKLNRVALGDMPKAVVLRTRTDGSSGDTGVEPGGGAGQLAQQRRLDEYELSDVDFIKLDCEGYELFALRGAVETIRRNKPVIIVEQKPKTGVEARYKIGAIDGVKFLQSLGMKSLHPPISDDWIMGW